MRFSTLFATYYFLNYFYTFLNVVLNISATDIEVFQVFHRVRL